MRRLPAQSASLGSSTPDGPAYASVDLMEDTSLPEWDLSDLFPGPDSETLEQSLLEAETGAKAFARRYQGKLPRLNGAELAAAIFDYERLDEGLSRIMAYASLRFAENGEDPARGRFSQTMHERVTAIAVHLLFFTLEINRLEESDLAAKQKHPALKRYAPWLRDTRLYRPHQLSDDLERLLHEKYVSGRAAWTRLFDETLAALRIVVAGEALTVTQALDRLSDASEAKRREAAKALSVELGRQSRLFAHITNTLAKDKEIEDRWRGYPQPWSSRHLANHVEDEVVEALATAVRQSYPTLSHRYYALKAKRLGKEKLDHWDRNAPLPEADNTPIGWGEAQNIVLDAYARFSPEMASLGRTFFERPWIDARPRPGKDSGAFSHPVVPGAHPYILMNYMGRTRDVMTLAHELGHGVHQRLASRQGHLLSQTPLTLAETASVFGEMLTFRSLAEATKDPSRRRALIASKVEDMLNTVVRQISFFEFERRIHTERRAGEVSLERICDLWMEVQGEALGPAFRLDDEYRSFWAYIGHFVHVPFYVYAYAFGDCLVNSLYAVYEEEEAAGRGPDFAARYLRMLESAGTLHHKELLAPFGLDLSDPAFWRRGLSLISRLIDEVERDG